MPETQMTLVLIGKSFFWRVRTNWLVPGIDVIHTYNPYTVRTYASLESVDGHSALS